MLQAVIYRDARLGIDDFVPQFVGETLQRMRAAHTNKATTVPVRVDVNHGLVLQLRSVILGPFRGAEQAGLLSIPSGINDRALWPPSVLHHLANSTSFFHERDHPAQRIACTERPPVHVVATNDPFVREFRTRQHRDHVIGRRQVPVELEFHVHAGGSRSEVVREWERSTPCGRCDWAAHRR